MTSHEIPSYSIKNGSSIKATSQDVYLQDKNVNIIQTMSGNITGNNVTFRRLKSMSGDIEINTGKGTEVSSISGNITLRGVNVGYVSTTSGTLTLTSCDISHLDLYNTNGYLNNTNIHTIETDANYFVIPSGSNVQVVVFKYGGKVKSEDNKPITVINGIQVSNQ